MTAVITASRWNAIHPTTRPGSPDGGHRRHSPAHHGLGTVLVPDRDRGPAAAVRLRPAGGHPRRPSGTGGRRSRPRPAAVPPRAKATGVPLSPRTTTPTTRPSAAGSASSAPTTSGSLACGSSPMPRPTARRAPRACAPATPRPSCSPRVLTAASPTAVPLQPAVPPVPVARAGPTRSPLSRKGASLCPFHRLRRTCT